MEGEVGDSRGDDGGDGAAAMGSTAALLARNLPP